ncbi:hypothetical protein [Erwinia rhapontici]|nr:hypothetical protein [Erwinia rhapontici]MBP2156457.1 hypothetical protein [Erwinia rhapontici]MCS3607472.1 hypothetical protein [Erwinia rhapontici]TDT02071.1 hypothetical protein EDF84_101803 [Erwinia rhapontici]
MENGFCIAMTPVQLAAVMENESVMKKQRYNNKPYYIATAYPVL